MTVSAENQEQLMVRFGITSVPAHIYYYSGWRYSAFADALAQAKRDQAAAVAGK